jgi:hypothetical protein
VPGEAASGALLLIFERSAGAYIVLSVLTGAGTEELRALAWSHVDLIGDPDAAPPVPPHMMVWRSVRAGGDTKTRRSRRTLALPQRCVSALRQQRVRQAAACRLAGVRWQEHDLLFASQVGTPLDAANARRDFRKVATTAGLPAKEWTPRELRNSFVSLFVRRRHADRTDLPARRAQRDDGHETRLPEADPPGGRARRHGDGPDLPARGDVVTQFVDTAPAPTTNGLARDSERVPNQAVSGVGVTGFETCDLFVPNADAGSHLLTGGVVPCRLTWVFLLVRLAA